MKLYAENVNKTIRRRRILCDVNLELQGGTVYGFIGRNGSGKTMLFRALSGLIRLDSGIVSLDGQVLHRDFSVPPSLGIVLENAGLYPDLTGLENLKYLAKLNRRIGTEEIREAISRVGLDPDDRRVYGKYSLGMKQRLAIAQAVMESPDVIMLDEPTNALDETGVEDVRRIILEERDRGALILLASHSKEDIRLLSDHVFRIEQGYVSEAEV